MKDEKTVATPIGWLCRYRSQTDAAKKAFPGDSLDYLWRYTHGTKDLSRFETYNDLEIIRVYANTGGSSAVDSKLNVEPEAPRKIRRVVCAAIRAEDGDVLLGIRHYSEDMHKQIDARRDGGKFKHRHGDDQGFIDQHGVYMTRKQAFDVAESADQIAYLTACDDHNRMLYSEGLY